MAYWRMKLRHGIHGEDMWRPCSEARVAAITYDGIQNVDLRPYSPENHPPGWTEIRGGSAKGSLRAFAWEMRGGDSIYVADSLEHQIVGMGYVGGAVGELAYRFDAESPIKPSNGDRWCHLIDVDWDRNFEPFLYEHPRAAIHTVLELNSDEVQLFERETQANAHRKSGLSEEEVQNTLLLETPYPRYTPAALRQIRREHVRLSNQFKAWLQRAYGIRAIQERQQIDATFELDGSRFLAEFKIAYQGNTKRAIREALGQILEYNHYPPRVSYDQWLLILDTIPCKEDIAFLLLLRETFHLPLTLGWNAGSEFAFEPPVNF
jgi:hypothetical protein